MREPAWWHAGCCNAGGDEDLGLDRADLAQARGAEWMRHRISRDLHGYWDMLRGDRAAPDRAEIDLAAIRGVLADTFLLEAGGRDAYPLRMSGTRVDALWGRDRRGLCFTALWRRSDQSGVAAALASVIEGVSPLVAGVRMGAQEETRLEMELLLLPLRHFGATPSRILGALAPLHAVPWLGRTPPGPLEMISTRALDGGAPKAAPPRGRKPRLVLVHKA
jgi:hypothetical protein